MKKNARFAMALLPFVLAACASKEKPIEQHCPQVAIVRDLSVMRDYGAANPDPSELVAAAAMKNFTGGCHYTDKGVDVNINLNFVAGKGPRLGGDRVGFPFFVSVMDPERKILRKELMTEDFTFGVNKRDTTREESLHILVPLADPKSDAKDYQILMGFQLTEEQIKAVREAKDNLPVPGR